MLLRLRDSLKEVARMYPLSQISFLMFFWLAYFYFTFWIVRWSYIKCSMLLKLIMISSSSLCHLLWIKLVISRLQYFSFIHRYVLKNEKADVYRLPYLSSSAPGFGMYWSFYLCRFLVFQNTRENTLNHWSIAIENCELFLFPVMSIICCNFVNFFPHLLCNSIAWSCKKGKFWRHIKSNIIWIFIFKVRQLWLLQLPMVIQNL